tara:strand:- start:4633 stop:5067 length:435 start_codon:yes stop_codon:yes gene_type:complete
MNDIKPKFYEQLKDRRKTKQVSLKEISEYTKINMGYLESLENGEFDVLPNVYTRLFLRSYCDYLGLDSKEILDEYQIFTVGNKKQDNFSLLDENSQNLNTDNEKIENQESSKRLKQTKDPKEIIIAISVIITIVILFIIISSAS